MIKSVLTKKEYEEIYRMLDEVSPIPSDCGEMCGAACCTQEYTQGEGPEMGIYLLPGEDKLHTPREDWLEWTDERAEDYEFPDSWRGVVHFVRCKTPPSCPREKRPIQCRTFPLTPYLDEEDQLSLLYNDWELPYHCPLIDEEIPLNEDFIEATYRAWEILLRDPLIYDLVKMDSKIRDEAIQTLSSLLGAGV